MHGKWMGVHVQTKISVQYFRAEQLFMSPPILYRYLAVELAMKDVEQIWLLSTKYFGQNVYKITQLI